MTPKGIITLNRSLSTERRMELQMRFRELLDHQGVSPRSLRFRVLLWRTGCKYQALEGM